MTQLVRDITDWVAISPSGRLIAIFDEPVKAKVYAQGHTGIKILKRTIAYEEVNND